MTSRYEVRLDAGGMTRHIFESIRADGGGQPGPAGATVRMEGGVMVARAESGGIAHLRASLNSYLRLAHAARGSLEAGRRHTD
ncbi:MAG: CTAG/PCC1 family protein [Nitrosopumilus sp.]|nr:CTAG/PCC1 family protein [Nitrosopumilus sp.]CAI9831991.1 putative Transcription factor Pcc1 protein [Nitrosopumilaceae archaeon]MDA7941766.1 CTAG/PCC1 family protein [Nitrosopumilus sp.]MDA7943699.1 CTAG/PCC1 family protein [Nitrosopumilus sp.]MDA7945564.1 CTAG/PCC1 family protein [Nitrosopumilus sp.]